MTKNGFERIDDTVYITREGWSTTVLTTYREDYYDELSSHTWRLDASGYPINNTLGGGLHRYIMAKWYGEDALKAFTKDGYVVDHINNEHYDCRISNLEFLLKDYNTAKGQQLDKDTARLARNIALSISKDFYTGCYQITIGCNDAIKGTCSDGTEYYVDSFKYLYRCDYPLVLNDAEGILLKYTSSHKICEMQPNSCATRIYHSPNIHLKAEEYDKCFVERNGRTFLVLGNGKNFLTHVAPDRNWLPPEHTGEVEHYIPIITGREN